MDPSSVSSTVQSLDWTQLGVIIGFNGALFGMIVALLIWMRGELRNDYRHLHEIGSQDRRDLLQLVRSIQEEIKDFHGRLERHDAEFKAHLMQHHK